MEVCGPTCGWRTKRYVDFVATIGVRALRQRASEYLARVEAGEVVDVTVRGRLVARLVPVTAADRTRHRLVASGSLRPARRPGGLAAIDTDALPPLNLSSILNGMRTER